jgi:hypothetical protein
MDKLPVKQVDGAMDLATDQRTESTKSFKGIVVTQDSANGPFMHMDGTFIYWLKHENIFDEIGNVRIGMSNGNLVMESYSDVWAKI